MKKHDSENEKERNITQNRVCAVYIKSTEKKEGKKNWNANPYSK